ncbi:MAG: hypothetical protein IPM74_06195 [Crocinitomicaceae bacterium]|nr:hypothetical protein [Crocinitomicaceae bacterium]MBK8925495.1 hypothetical protein [Crocinitomicaceae bacterium]
MSFIHAYGTCIPAFRIEDRMLNPKGKKNAARAVCYTDEDVITLAYEASKECLVNSKNQPEAILFANSSPVFFNRYHASFLGDLLGLPSTLYSLDLVNSLKSGTDAIILANSLINAGQFKNILVICSDVHYTGIGNELYTNHGHGACALLLSNQNGNSEIVNAISYGSHPAEEYDYKNQHLKMDARYGRDAGFKNCMFDLVKQHAKDFPGTDKIILNSPYAKLAGPVFMKAGCGENQFSRDSLTSMIGNTGCVHAVLQIISEIENGTKNIMAVDYANGTNFLQISTKQNDSKSWTEKLNQFNLIQSYQDYLTLRKEGNFNSRQYKTREMFSSEMMNDREQEAYIRLKAQKCVSCGTAYLIKTLRCKKCHSENFETVQLANHGQVYSCTKEHYFPVSFPPVSMLVIDLEGGGRITVQQTDTMYPDQNDVEIGSSVKLVLRKMVEHDEKPNYFLKAIKA